MKASTLGLVAALDLASQNDARAAELEGRFTHTFGVARNPSLDESKPEVDVVLVESRVALGVNFGGPEADHTSSVEGTAGAQWAPGNSELNKVTGELEAQTSVNEDGNLGVTAEVSAERKARVAEWLPNEAPYVQTDELSGSVALQIHPHGKKSILQGELGLEATQVNHTFGLEGQNETQATLWTPQAGAQYKLFPSTHLLCSGDFQILNPNGASTLPVEAAQAWSATCGMDTLLNEEEGETWSGLTFRVGAGQVNDSQPYVLGALGGRIKVGGFTATAGLKRAIEETYPIPELEVISAWRTGVEWQGPGDRLKVGVEGGQRWRGGTPLSTDGKFDAAYRVGKSVDLGVSVAVKNHNGAQDTTFRVGAVVPLGH